MITQATWPDVLHVALNMRDDDHAEVMATRWNDDPYDFAAECMRLPGAKVVVKDEFGIPVCIGGSANWIPGVAQMWLVGTDDISRHGIEVAHAARNIIQTLFDTGTIHRVQAFSSATHKRAHRWMTAIGMREESRLSRYGKNGEDFIIFSALKEV